MKIEWKRPHIFILVAVVLVTILLLTFMNQQLIEPLEGQVKQTESSLEMEQKILATLQEKKETSANSASLNNTSRETQLKLPVLPVMDQFFIALERAENASESLVTSFAQDGAEEVDIPIPNEKKSNDSSTSSNADQEQAETPEEAGQEVDPQPNQPIEDAEKIMVNKMTFQVSVQSLEFEGLLAFLEELKDLPRMIDITSISFEGPRVEEAQENETQLLDYTVTVSTFYDKSNSILQDELPQYHYGDPSYKDNPLLNAEDQEEDSDDSDTNNEDNS
ncbi:hypothetical protein GLW05_06800 [Pontibacillus yanchengensis]|uniref:Pilus assembly protein PilO n=1 Tax=Pontibacillus yanchengensis TaxID=462910 RepID=A0A6I4ZSV9_9BACI|nr:hypothetical protein [Pontibacillus yanchengensis]MYL33308.1 hypothetical protein [Pontibacillus yanchengensis]